MGTLTLNFLSGNAVSQRAQAAMSPSLIRRLRRCTWADRGRLLAAAVVCVGIWGALRLFSLRRLVRWTGSVSHRGERPDEEVVDRTIWAVQAVSARLFPARPCLPQSLTARFLLARHGVPTDLRIGVRKGEEDELCAHAWLESGDEVLLGGEASPAAYHILTAS